MTRRAARETMPTRVVVETSDSWVPEPFKSAVLRQIKEGVEAFYRENPDNAPFSDSFATAIIRVAFEFSIPPVEDRKHMAREKRLAPARRKR